MAWDWKKIGKSALIGAGTILSFINPALGAPLIVAGTAIQTDGTKNSTDTVSLYAANLNASMNTAAAMQQAGSASMATSNLMNKIVANLPLIIAGLLGIVLLPKLIKAIK